MTTFLEVQDQLIEARAAVQAWGADVRERRADLARAIQSFQTPINREQLMRAHVEAERQHRQDLKDGKVVVAPPPRLASPLDRTAFYGSGGNADDFARRMHTTGHRRGAYGANMKGRKVAPPSQR